MKRLKKRGFAVLAAVAIATGLVSSARADFIINHNNANPPVADNPPSDAPYLGSFANGQAGSAQVQAFLTSIHSPLSLGSQLYKIDNGSGEASGWILNSSYSTAPVPWQSGVEPITISYTGGRFADASVLVVKDGNLGSYVFDITGWNGKENLLIYNVFDPTKKTLSGTSHIEFFGAAVPEPTTVIAGIGALGLLLGAGVHKRRSVLRIGK